jgi:pSer/pThr/pTyr-binding forkhead associated (FHA) protein
MKMNTCPLCHADNLADAVFCDNCGASLHSPAAPQEPVPQASPAAAAAVGAADKRCGACGAINEATSLYCEDCGTALTVPQAIPVAPVALPSDSTPAQPAQPVSAAPTAQAVPVMPASSRSPAAAVIPPVPSIQPAPAGHARVVVVASGMYFDIDGWTELTIGRVDPISEIFPEIDLTAHGGEEGGVSRKHCRITMVGHQFFAEDLNSSNGSWIGANRLMPGARMPLNNGDQLRLGKVVLSVTTGV